MIYTLLWDYCSHSIYMHFSDYLLLYGGRWCRKELRDRQILWYLTLQCLCNSQILACLNERLVCWPLVFVLCGQQLYHVLVAVATAGFYARKANLGQQQQADEDALGNSICQDVYWICSVYIWYPVNHMSLCSLFAFAELQLFILTKKWNLRIEGKDHLFEIQPAYLTMWSLQKASG